MENLHMNIPVDNCSSCAACANVCNRNAIQMKLDSEGFYRPVIDSKICIHCGLCERICPWNNLVDNPNDAKFEPKTLAAYAKDEYIRLQSSSGGIFTVLAKKILDDHGVVVGVAQLDRIHFAHIIVENIDDLAKLRGSKYVLADVGCVYRKVRSLLKTGRKILFSGTPCQVAALYSVLGNCAKSANLFTIDIVCHGMPSVKVFEKYIVELEKKNNSDLDWVKFRDKSDGWGRYALLHRFKSEKEVFVHACRSDYMRLFVSRICQNKSCVECKYRKLPRIADITLGDFWGVSKYHPHMNDNKGTSVVLLNTTHGMDLFSFVEKQVTMCESRVEYAVANNPCIVKSGMCHPKRTEFFLDLDKITFNQLIKKYFPKQSMMKRLFLHLRSFLRILKPGKLTAQLMVDSGILTPEKAAELFKVRKEDLHPRNNK